MHHRIQLAAGDTTMSGWKQTLSLILTPSPRAPFNNNNKKQTKKKKNERFLSVSGDTLRIYV